MPLKLSLKPGEKFVLNGAVVQNGDRRGVLLVQLSPRMEVDHARLDYFLSRVPQGLAVAVEFRHPSWYEEIAFRILRAFDRPPTRLLVDVLALCELLLEDIHFLHVMQPARPLAGAQADHAAHDLGDSLRDDKRAGDRDVPQDRHLRPRAAAVLAEQAADHDRVPVLHHHVAGDLGDELVGQALAVDVTAGVLGLDLEADAHGLERQHDVGEHHLHEVH